MDCHKMFGWGVQHSQNLIENPSTDHPDNLPEFMRKNRSEIMEYLFRDMQKFLTESEAPELLNGIWEWTLGTASVKDSNPTIYSTDDLILFRPVNNEWFRDNDPLDMLSNPREETFTVEVSPLHILSDAPMIRFRDPSPDLREYLQADAQELNSMHDENGPLSIPVHDWQRLTEKIQDYSIEDHLELWKHYKNNFRVPLPLIIIAQVMWAGVAKDLPALLDELRPMVHTWWD